MIDVKSYFILFLSSFFPALIAAADCLSPLILSSFLFSYICTEKAILSLYFVDFFVPYRYTLSQNF